jgi:uncharacterized protein YecA (UPF0149 family)
MQMMANLLRHQRPAALIMEMLARDDKSPEKVGRNDPCPCGSGKKYKKCCGAGGL